MESSGLSCARPAYWFRVLGKVSCLLLFAFGPGVAGPVGAGGATAEPAAAAPRSWAIGETVDVEVVAPVDLAVFQPGLTAALRDTELPRVPPVFRHDESVAAAVEAELRSRFVAARAQFVSLIEAGFQRKTLQAVAELSDARFFQAIEVFRSRNAGFPLSTNLAELWALGDEGRVVLDDLAGQLRRFMAVYIRGDRLPEGERLAAPAIRIVAADLAGPAVPAVAARVATVARTNLYALTRYRRELDSLAPPAEKTTIAFLAGFIRPNCVFDEEATAQARARRTQDLNVVDRYAAGAVVARRGQVVDARLQRVLEALRAQSETEAVAGSAARLQAELERARTEASQLQSRVEAERRQAARAAAAVTAVRQDAATMAQRNRRLLAGAGVATGACLIFAGLWWRHRSRQRRLESSADWAVVPAGRVGNEAELWRERALAAEARAEKATAMLRTNLLPHLARWMMTELVQRLLWQRTAANSSQQRAELEVAELAERLEKLHAPLEERRRAYERRIAELEAELAARDEQDHELIQARIDSTRRRLQADREANESLNLAG